jgi:hypothetical protein
MVRGLISAAGISALLTALATAPTSSWAQDLNTCSGRLSYCTEWARRAGAPTTQCEAAYQECQRTGVVPDRRYLDNPYAAPAARGNPANPYPGAVDRQTNDPYMGPIERQFCQGRTIC